MESNSYQRIVSSDAAPISTIQVPVDVERVPPRRPLSLHVSIDNNSIHNGGKRSSLQEPWRPRGVEEALSTMLWQPYECRNRASPAGSATSSEEDSLEDRTRDETKSVPLDWHCAFREPPRGPTPRARYSDVPRYGVPHSFTDDFVKLNSNRFSDDFSRLYPKDDPFPLLALATPAYSQDVKSLHSRMATPHTDDFGAADHTSVQGGPHSTGVGEVPEFNHLAGRGSVHQSQRSFESRGMGTCTAVEANAASASSACASRPGNGKAKAYEVNRSSGSSCVAVKRDASCGSIYRGLVFDSAQSQLTVPVPVSECRETKTDLRISASVPVRGGGCVSIKSDDPDYASVLWGEREVCETNKHAMRVSVPAPPQTWGQATPPKIISNGTLMGSLIPVNNHESTSSAQGSVNIVNCYRAIPVTVVSSVPSIQCLNPAADGGNVVQVNNTNTSNVEVFSKSCADVYGRDGLGDNSEVSAPNVNNICNVRVVSTSASNLQTGISQSTPNLVPLTPAVHRERNVQVARTFTSTEAQTDDVIAVPESPPNSREHLQAPQSNDATQSLISREERRRERRERRHNRRLLTTSHVHVPPSLVFHPHPTPPSQFTPGQLPPPGAIYRPDVEIMPDILHSHVPPAYSTLPMGAHVVGSAPMGPIAGPGPIVSIAGPMPGPDDIRYAFPVGIRRSVSEPRGKGCCGFGSSRPPLRALIAVVALGGVACALGGAALGALRLGGPPTSHLTAALLMIGVGIILVTVSGAAWRLSAPGSPPCRALLGFGRSNVAGSGGVEAGGCPRRFSPRAPPPCGRPSHPYGAMMYPEFQHRQPPPSYQASMQEYRLRLLLLDRQSVGTRGVQGASPPPTYRSHAGSLLRAPLTSRCPAPGSEYSLPPSYRSRHTQARPAPSIGLCSQDANFDLPPDSDDIQLTNNPIDSAENVDDVLSNLEDIDAIKICPDRDIAPLRMLLKNPVGLESLTSESTKDGNLVSIVQTGDESRPVIVTVSGCSAMDHTSNGAPTEMDILAHL